MSTAAATVVDRRAFWLRKLHSLSGVVPVGAFMCFHLFENASAANGPEAFDETVRKINSMPFVLAMEIGVIWIPILFHTLLGFAIIFEGRPNVAAYGHGRNWLYLLQRVTGVLAFLFIAFHFANFRMRKGEFELAPFEDVAAVLSTPWVFWVYLAGIAACVFHFANGLAGFLFSWGLTVGPRAKRLAGLACAGVGAGVFALSMRALFAFV
ncbi:MAG: succinate dehydrogenase [Planctomycetaceae bacterium]|nr:succinate dehydrogenase [Planctomycetota bacterium]NUN51928.1 succinate dehydrogenase [Planctomycetaceae bacterium]